jgi:hypothetical protein
MSQTGETLASAKDNLLSEEWKSDAKWGNANY